MIQAFVITLREGLEAFLIIAISLAYLRKSGNHHLVPAVHWGILASVVLSVAAGALFARAANQALWEGVLAMVAAVMVASLTVHMWRAGRRMKSDIEGRLKRSTIRVGTGAFLGVFGFTLLMISREGMETALMMNALLFQVQSAALVTGAVAGVLCAAAVAMLWARLRPPGQSGTVLPGYGDLSSCLRRSAVHLWFPRAHRSQHSSVQRNTSLGNRTVRAGWALRQVLHLPTRAHAARLAHALVVASWPAGTDREAGVVARP